MTKRKLSHKNSQQTDNNCFLLLPPTHSLTHPWMHKSRWRTWCQLCLKYHAGFFRRWIPTNLNLSPLMHGASEKQQLVREKNYLWNPLFYFIKKFLPRTILIAFSQYLNISILAKLGKFCSIFRQVWVDISFLFPAQAAHHPPWFFDQPNPWRGPFSRYLFTVLCLNWNQSQSWIRLNQKKDHPKKK